MTPTSQLKNLAQLGAGHRDWYTKAHREILFTAPILSTTPFHLASLLSIFSPRCSVTRSIRRTIHYLQTSTFTPDTPRSTRAALSHYLSTTEIRGPKTHAYRDALLGYKAPLVLDTWMAKALNMPQRSFSTFAGRGHAYRLISPIADSLGWSITETQAAIWAGTLISHNRVPTPLSLVPELPTLFLDPPNA